VPPVPSQNDSQPGVISQILSQTYSNSVLQNQLSHQGLVPGFFVSPVAANDYLFNPNATSLVDAMLLAAHSPNTQLSQARSLELGASMTPIIGAVSTWMNPNSGWFSKGLAVAGVVPMVSQLAGELGSLSALEEFSTLGPQLPSSLSVLEETVESSVSQWRTQEVEDLLQRAEEAGLRVSANGPESWTPRQIEAAIEYREVYNRTLSPQLAGTAAHSVLGAPTSGADRMYFGFVNEIKTSIGVPDVSVFVDAMEQAESYEPGQPAVVTVFDMLNGVKYFVQRGP
jgi:hypothetical protein